ncbi:MAG: DNA recombination protein RmuC [Saprospiraceae bacterium]|nr:DNA recombination protein RmuC [Saprospiraceae bacterium]
MITVELTFLILLCLLAATTLGIVLMRKPSDHGEVVEGLGQDIQALRVQMDISVRQELSQNRKEASMNAKEARQELSAALDSFGKRQSRTIDLVNGQIKHLVSSNEERFIRLQETTILSLDKIRGEVDKRLQAMQADNTQSLEKMRHTVDEKLHQTLEERLGRSFKLVSDHLEKVQRGLGEMQSLAAGVGDLRKVLANVKTRGILGEIQLLNIIEEMMTPDQYALNIATVPGRDSRVEVAIRFPGKTQDESCVYLPIDSKFPMDRYQVLSDAYESGCSESVAQSSKELARAITTCAKEIRKKYISAPYTTDFAIMFLPVEGLYAEVSRQSDLLYKLRSEFKIMVAGPSNLSAFLSSLQMGFRTLAIEKRSSEVWTLLSEIKTEFGKFGVALDKVQKKINEANNAIDQAGVRSRAIERRLNKVEELPDTSQPLALETARL